MLYDIDIRIESTSAHIRETIEANSKEEAEALAREMGKEGRASYRPIVEVRNSVAVSDKNFTYLKKAIYMVGRYSKFSPAICTNSFQEWRKSSYEHEFTFLETGKIVTIKGAKPNARVISKPLCLDGELTELCETCIAKFICFTRRGKNVS